MWRSEKWLLKKWCLYSFCMCLSFCAGHKIIKPEKSACFLRSQWKLSLLITWPWQHLAPHFKWKKNLLIWFSLYHFLSNFYMPISSWCATLIFPFIDPFVFFFFVSFASAWFVCAKLYPSYPKTTIHCISMYHPLPLHCFFNFYFGFCIGLLFPPHSQNNTNETTKLAFSMFHKFLIPFS